jgi:hypothetical protein
MPILDMSAGHIAAQAGFFEPQRQNNALLRIEGLLQSDLVTLSLESFPMPKFTINPVEAMYLNTRSKFAGNVNVEDLTIVVRDFVDVQTALVLWDWFLETHDPYTGRNGLARYYKKAGTITTYGPNGFFDREMIVQGLWINNMDPGDIDMSADDILKISLTCSCDRALPSAGFYSGRVIPPV